MMVFIYYHKIQKLVLTAERPHVVLDVEQGLAEKLILSVSDKTIASELLYYRCVCVWYCVCEQLNSTGTVFAVTW